MKALQREEEEKERESEQRKDELDDYQLDSVECVDTATASAILPEQSKKRSATTQQPPVTPRPHKLMHPSHTDLLASAKKSNNRVRNSGSALFR